MRDTRAPHTEPAPDLSRHTLPDRGSLAAGALRLLEEAKKISISLPTMGPVVSIADLEEMVALVQGGE